MSSIFAKQDRVRPTQLHTVADRRFRDAEALCATGNNERANGAMYLLGLVIEIQLKAQMMNRFPELTRSQIGPHPSRREQMLSSLVWRKHDLEALLRELPHLESALLRQQERTGVRYRDFLKAVCATWTIHARYSTSSTTIAEANQMLEQVRVLKGVLR